MSYMARHKCCICGKTLGLFSVKTDLADGAVCYKCLENIGMLSLGNNGKVYVKQVVELAKSRKNIVSCFNVSFDAGDIELDTNAHVMKIKDDYFFFNELLSYSYHEYPERTTAPASNKKSGGAAIGGIIGGLGGGMVGSAIGAAVGSKIGSLFTGSCEYLYINIVLNNSILPQIKLSFIKEKTNVSSSEYATAVRRAKESMEALRYVSEYNASQKQSETSNTQKQKVSDERVLFVQKEHLTAEQIERELNIYHNMNYNGLITDEEYEMKKKQLLSLR